MGHKRLGAFGLALALLLLVGAGTVGAVDRTEAISEVMVWCPVQFSRSPATEVTLEVFVLNNGRWPCVVDELEVSVAGGGRLSAAVERSLAAAGESRRLRAEALSKVPFGDPRGFADLDDGGLANLVRLFGEAGDSLAVIYVTVDLAELTGTPLEGLVGHPVRLEVTARGRGAGWSGDTAVESEVTILDAASVPGFQAGDMHLHSNQYGDDGLSGISSVCQSAASKGMQFLTFTPHAQKLDSIKYSQYKTAVNNAAVQNNLVASTDLELSSRFEYELTTAYVPYTVSGTAITSWTGNSDDGYHQTSLPFSFPFYGAPRSALYISTNGFVSFSSSGASSPSYTSIPNTNTPNAFIAPFWRDLNPGAGGTVYLSKTSSEVKVTWYMVPIKGTSNLQTFQLLLYPSGEIKFMYISLQSPGSPCVGVEDNLGQYGAQYFGSLYGDWGLEARKRSSGDSHYLAHNVSSFISNPNPETRTGEGLINAVNAQTSAYGCIAHPYAANYPWLYWTKASGGSSQIAVTGFRGLELMSNERQATSATLSKWDSLLLGGLQSTIQGNGFVVGFAGSDMHFLSQSSWGRCMNYVRAGKSISDIHLQARTGRVVASGDGSATSFEAVHGSTVKYVGDVLNVPSGGTVTLRGQVVLTGGSSFTKLRLIRNGSYVTDIPVQPDRSWSTTVSTTTDCYYRVELVTSDGSNTYYTYANPIFLNVP